MNFSSLVGTYSNVPICGAGTLIYFYGKKPPDRTLLESARLFFLGRDSTLLVILRCVTLHNRFLLSKIAMFPPKY